MTHAAHLSRDLALAAGRSVTAEPIDTDPAEAVRSLIGGDTGAFTRVYTGYARMVRAILLGRVPHRDVDDLLQDVFVSAYTRIRELRDPAAFGGWIAAIARNKATD